jgi:hypothetical protein
MAEKSRDLKASQHQVIDQLKALQETVSSDRADMKRLSDDIAALNAKWVYALIASCMGQPLIALFISAKRHVSSQRWHSRGQTLTKRNQLAMTKLGISVGILATVFCQSVGAQTISVLVLDQAGAQTVLQTAKESVQKLNAPSAIAVVDPAGDLLAFQRMDGVRPASSDLAIEKARTAARYNGQRRRSRTTLIGAERHSSPPESRHCAAACRYA